MLFNRWCARESVKRGSLFLGACWCCIMISHVLILEKETGEKKMKPVSTLAFPSLPACSPRRRFVSLLTHLSLSCVLQASGVYLKKKKKSSTYTVVRTTEGSPALLSGKRTLSLPLLLSPPFTPASTQTHIQTRRLVRT